MNTYKQSICRLLLLTSLVLAITGCDQLTDHLSTELIVTNKYIGAGIRQDEKGFAYADFKDTQATDGRLKKLQEVIELKEVYLAGTDATDIGLGYLRDKTMMTDIHIENTGSISDAGLKNLPFESPLTSLTILGTQVSNAGMESVARCMTLKYLAVEGLTDEGYRPLSNLQELESLDLLRCKITDEGIESLAKLKNLKTLQLTQCEIAKPVERRLRDAMPQTKILSR